MTIRPIRTKGDYDKAMARARALMVRDDQNSIDELEVLQVLIENWERTHHPIAEVTPADAIRFRMGQTGLKPRDRSEEHTSELQSLMRSSYAGFCLKQKPKQS